MSNCRFYLFLVAMVGAGFFAGYHVGTIGTLLGAGWKIALGLLAYIAACAAVTSALVLGCVVFATEIESCEYTVDEHGKPASVTLAFGPWRWTREIPTTRIGGE